MKGKWLDVEQFFSTYETLKCLKEGYDKYGLYKSWLVLHDILVCYMALEGYYSINLAFYFPFMLHFISKHREYSINFIFFLFHYLKRFFIRERKEKKECLYTRVCCLYCINMNSSRNPL